MITSIYSQGTAEEIQDAHSDNLPFVWVVDCHSGINIRGGVIRDIFLSNYLMSPLKINDEILACQKNMDVGNRAGAVFALAEINSKSVKIIQGGDSLAVWQLRSGEIGFTPNKYETFDIQAIENYTQLMKKYGGDKEKVWPEQKEFLANIRKRFANQKYAVLNGDPRVKDCWFKIEIPKKDLDTILLFTDGLITGLPKRTDRKILLEGLLKMSKNDGLEALVGWVRSHQKENLKDAHIQYPEISVVSVKF